LAAEKRQAVAAAVYDAMSAVLGIPDGDRFIILTAHPQSELIVDPHFMKMQRTADFVLVHITLRRGRSTEKKQAFYKEVVERVGEKAGIAPDNVMIVLSENDLDDWSFGKGEAQYVQSQQSTKASN
jgi:phenylpyruvate tautomerase PptA (4-oxalocrotonate tautomerase family)